MNGRAGSGLVDRAAAWVERLEYAASTVAALALFVIMLTVFVDVLLRYLFNAPLSWSYDFISLYLMGAAFFFALSETLRRNHHVAVDILYLRLSLRARRWWRLVGWSLSLALFAVIFVLAVRTAWSRWQGDNVVAGAIPWPTWIPAAIAAGGFLLLLVRLALGVVGISLALLARRPLAAAVAGEDVATAAE
jgi:TRAP-type C4-dicarboxylate transport system permease small subunit